MSAIHETGSFDERCRVLMLSATPYKMYTIAGEPGEEDHYRDFLETVGFLFGREEPKEELRESLNELRTGRCCGSTKRAASASSKYARGSRLCCAG